jgi:hypothetical protein
MCEINTRFKKVKEHMENSIAELSPPKFLYKYIDWGNGHHKELVTIPQVYFARIGDFNDPYDCGVSPRYDRWTEDDWTKTWRKILESKFPRSNKYEIESEINQLIENHRTNPNNTIDTIEKQSIQYINERMGIFSLSATNKSILMWSHYSNAHQGLCIGYRSNEIFKHTKQFLELIYPHPKWIHFHKVQYKNKYPRTIRNPNEVGIDSFKIRLECKLKLWEYEREWRLVIGVGAKSALDKRAILIPIDAIAKIYIGLRMPQQHIVEVISNLKRLKYGGELYQVFKKRYSYRLETSPINF